MFPSLRSAVVAAALAVAAGAPLAASAESSALPAHLDLTTKITQDHAGGEWDGRLHLSLSPNGTIGGFYLADGGYGPVSVQGGVQPDGNNLWLSIGNGIHPLYVTGTLHDGTIVASALSQSGFPTGSIGTLTLNATPATHR